MRPWVSGRAGVLWPSAGVALAGGRATGCARQSRAGPAVAERPGQRGSVLLLFPAAVLIVMVLAAITVDSSIAFLAQRELANATAAAANDAAGEGVDGQAFYRDDRIALDPAAVEAVAIERVRLAIDESRHQGLEVQASASPPARAGCPWTVRVSASSQVSYVFAKALPGGPDAASVRATSVAGPEQDATAGSCGL